LFIRGLLGGIQKPLQFCIISRGLSAEKWGLSRELPGPEKNASWVPTDSEFYATEPTENLHEDGERTLRIGK
jgi:hypothetical protein